jgi:hypothetical protein
MTVQRRRTLWFLSWLGLLLFEVILVIAFHVVPQFQSHEFHTHPNVGFEMDATLQKYPSLRVALLAYSTIFVFGNAGLIVMVWRSYQNLRPATRND